MQTVKWQPVLRGDKSGPSARWGHGMCHPPNSSKFFLFGGYLNSTYLNDLWQFDLLTMKWLKIVASGQCPSHRSNFTMNNYPNSNRIIIFGGGAADRVKYNCLYSLDWRQQRWSKIIPSSSTRPDQRSYHCGEFVREFLFVFGGESHADLSDLWGFDFRTNLWKEITFNKDVSPGQRRFANAVAIGDHLYVLGGCKDRYVTQTKSYSLDLQEFVENNVVSELKWQQGPHNVLLGRWGHNTMVYKKWILVYSGRNGQDDVRLVKVSIQTGTVQELVTKGSPPGRRRGAMCLVGSCLVTFGGYNGEYLDDFHWLDLSSLNECFVESAQSVQEQLLFQTSFIESPKQLLSLQNQLTFRAETGDLHLIHNFNKTYECNHSKLQKSSIYFQSALSNHFNFKHQILPLNFLKLNYDNSSQTIFMLMLVYIHEGWPLTLRRINTNNASKEDCIRTLYQLHQLADYYYIPSLAEHIIDYLHRISGVLLQDGDRSSMNCLLDFLQQIDCTDRLQQLILRNYVNLIQKHYRSWIIEPHQILGTCKGRKVYGDNKFMLRQLELLKEKEEYADNPEGKLSKSNIHEAQIEQAIHY